MPHNIIKTTGQLKSANPVATSSAKYNFPVIGTVKDNIDPNRSGRIRVLLNDSNNPQDSDSGDNWVSVSFLSSFFGKVGATGGSAKDDNGAYTSNPSSYGQWQAPPDIGTKVVCIFVNGDLNYGFYIGAIPEPEVLHMVPAIGASDNIIANEGEAKSYGGATKLPVTNMNTNNKGQVDSPDFNNSTRPVHSYAASIMMQQGILRDPVRGPISSSASREPASRVGWGVSSPGRPIYEGGYDDSTLPSNIGDNADPTKLKVTARRGGHSIVMDDGDIIGKDQLIRIRTALGHQILMSDDGQTLMILHSNGQSYVELGKEGTVDIYSTNSFNVRTHGDINLHSDRNINIHANENLNIQAKNIQTNSEEKTQMRAASDLALAATGKITGLAGGAIAWGAGGDASLVGGGQAYVNGSKVNLNSGSPGTSPASVNPIPLVAQTDTLFDEEKGYMAAPGKLLTITSRAPAHAPWANAGQGVDIKTSTNASDNLPAPAAGATQATNQAAQATNPTAPSTATVASAPTNAPSVSTSVTKNVTAATVASTATQAANGPLASVTKSGAGIIKTAQGFVAAIGTLAMTAAQLEVGGVLKPGAGTLVNALAQGGKPLSQAMPNSVFSGSVNGVTNLTSLVQNTTAQATALVNTMQKAQTALGAIGAITGKEAPTQIAGLITSVATVGLGPTVGAIQQVANAAGIGNKASSTLSSIAAGGTVSNAAAGALNSVAGSTLGNANNAIQKIAGQLETGLNTLGSATGLANSLTGSAAGVLGGAASAIGTANQVLGAAGALNTGKALGSIQNALSTIGAGGAAAQLTEAVGGLGGIQNALSAMNSVPSLSGLVNQVEGVATSAFNAVKNSFKPLKAGVPQNLTKIAKDNAAASAAVATTTGSQAGSSTLNQLGKLTKGASTALTDILNTTASVVNSTVSSVGAVNGAIGAVSSINNTVSSITGAVTTKTNALSNLANGAKAVTTTINNVTSVVNTIQNSVTSTPLNTTIGGVQHAINNVNAVAGAASTLQSGGGLPALSNAATVVQQGAQAATSSALASGLNNLAGGLNTVANVINNAPNAINDIPGVSALKDNIGSATTALMNGAGTVASATKALSSIANTANSLSKIGGASSLTGGSNKGAFAGILGIVSNELNGLTSLASAGLPVGAIAQLQSAISSLTNGVPGSISLPSVGFNTNDRTSVTSAIKSVLGDPKIPAPNLVGEIDINAQKTAEENLAKATAALDKARSDLQAQFDKINPLMKAYDDAVKQYGPNDPRTQAAYDIFDKARNDPAYTNALKQMSGALDAKTDATSSAVNTAINNVNAAQTPEQFLALVKQKGI